jgi:hypothetical protein
MPIIPLAGVPLDEIPYSHMEALVTTSAVCLFLAWTATILRFWTRAYIVGSVGWDDWTMLMALVRWEFNHV